MYEFLASFKQPPLLREVSETGLRVQPSNSKLSLALRPDTPALTRTARASTNGQLSSISKIHRYFTDTKI